MADRQHPAENAEEWSLAPAVWRAAALHCAHAFDEPSNHREEQVETDESSESALHVAHGTPSAASDKDTVAKHSN